MEEDPHISLPFSHLPLEGNLWSITDPDPERGALTLLIREVEVRYCVGVAFVCVLSPGPWWLRCEWNSMGSLDMLYSGFGVYFLILCSKCFTWGFCFFFPLSICLAVLNNCWSLKAEWKFVLSGPIMPFILCGFPILGLYQSWTNWGFWCLRIWLFFFSSIH